MSLNIPQCKCGKPTIFTHEGKPECRRCAHIRQNKASNNKQKEKHILNDPSGKVAPSGD